MAKMKEAKVWCKLAVLGTGHEVAALLHLVEVDIDGRNAFWAAVGQVEMSQVLELGMPGLVIVETEDGRRGYLHLTTIDASLGDHCEISGVGKPDDPPDRPVCLSEAERLGGR